jgi:pimeloyl-ACP methyl ester carboxylesterase
MMKKTEEVCFMPDGANIEYTVSGSGLKALLIHGSQRSSSELDALVEILSKRHAVYCIDRRGWGNSAAKGQDYSMEKECSDIIRLMADNGIEHIIAQEYGCAIALHVALKHPYKMAVLFEPYLTSLRKLSWLPRLTRQVERGDYFGAMATFVKGDNHKAKFVPGFLMKALFKHSSFSIDRDKQIINKIVEYDDPEMGARAKKDIESAEWKERKKTLRLMPEEIRAAKESEQELVKLHSIETKALIICERDSEPYVYDSAAQLAALIPNSRKIVVDMGDDKERPPLDPPPADFGKAVAEFFAGGAAAHV